MNSLTLPCSASRTDVLPTAPLKTAVLFLIFNRPDVTSQVFEAIRAARPPRLYIAADGARPTGPRARSAPKPESGRASRLALQSRRFSERKNLGCSGPSAAAHRLVFPAGRGRHHLEDDCLPVQSFSGMQELLEKYRHDQRVGQISGTWYLQQRSIKHGHAESFVFSKYGPIWAGLHWGGRERV